MTRPCRTNLLRAIEAMLASLEQAKLLAATAPEEAAELLERTRVYAAKLLGRAA